MTKGKEEVLNGNYPKFPFNRDEQDEMEIDHCEIYRDRPRLDRFDADMEEIQNRLRDIYGGSLPVEIGPYETLGILIDQNANGNKLSIEELVDLVLENSSARRS